MRRRLGIELAGVKLVDSVGVEILDQSVMTKPKGQVTWDDGEPGVSRWHDRLEVGPDC